MVVYVLQRSKDNMRFSYNNGVPVVILENGDELKVATNKDTTPVSISCESNQIDIAGDSSIVNHIDPNFMDKIFIPKKMSRQSILTEYDRWLAQFDEALDIFSCLLSKEDMKYKDVGIKLRYLDNKNSYIIMLSLWAHRKTIQCGPYIEIDKGDEGMAGYFIGYTLYSYIKTLYTSEDLNIDDIQREDSLPEVDHPKFPKAYSCDLSLLHGFSGLAYGIIYNFKLGFSPESIFDSYKERVLIKSDLDSYDERLCENEKRLEIIKKLNDNSNK